MRIDIWEEGEYSYPAAYGFKPNLVTYLHEDEEVRECMLVVPGGGYCMVVGHEGESYAKKFYEQGMNCFVLTYTTDITMSVPLQKQPLYDLSRAIRLIRANAAQFHVDPAKICIIGSSAGGHLCATSCTHYEDAEETNAKYKDYSARPDAAILCYPVITAGPYTHPESIYSLVGYEATQEERDYFSLEKHVKPDTPPCFLWHTLGDGLVPAENSYLYAAALREHKITASQIFFPAGDHGLALADEDHFKGVGGGEYTFEQLGLALDAVKNGRGVNVSQRRKDELMVQFFGSVDPDAKKNEGSEEKKPAAPAAPDNLNPYPEVRMWPELARCFLNRIFV